MYKCRIIISFISELTLIYFVLSAHKAMFKGRIIAVVKFRISRMYFRSLMEKSKALCLNRIKSVPFFKQNLFIFLCERGIVAYYLMLLCTLNVTLTVKCVSILKHISEWDQTNIFYA